MNGKLLLSISCVFIAIFNFTVSAAELSMEEALKIGARIRNAAPKDLSFEHAEKIETQLAGKEIRVLQGRHILLFTDLPASKEIDRLPEIFDEAVPLWTEFFRMDPELTQQWKIIAVLVDDSSRFASTPLLKRVPNLRHGFSLGNWLWIRDQPSDYYRRHLLLHEGVHGFMNHFFGYCGPNWYMEGLAEMLGTHYWDEKKKTLTLPYFPEDRDEVPLWGRILLVQKMREETPNRSIMDIMSMKFDGADDTQCYAQSWALCAFFNGHPLYRDLLRDFVTDVSRKEGLTRQFLKEIESIESGRVHLDWSDFLDNLDFGYDFQRTAIDSYAPGVPLQRTSQRQTIRADHGWQNSGVLLEKGKAYSFRTSGRFQIGKEPVLQGYSKILWCEPNGVTIRYHRERPLGLLLATIVSDGKFHAPISIGNSATWKSPETGTLFFRVNDSAAELHDNDGTMNIEIQKR